MASRVVMPKLSDTMEEGRILRWLKNEGDAIETGQALAEVETDKATVEMEAYTNGTIRKLIATEGQFVKVGDLIAIIGAPGEDVSALVPAARRRRPPAAPAAVPGTSPGADSRRRPAGACPPRLRGPAPTGRSLQGLAARAAHGRRSRRSTSAACRAPGRRAASSSGTSKPPWRRRQRLPCSPAGSQAGCRSERGRCRWRRRAKRAPRARTSNSRPCAAPSRNAWSRARARCRTST